MVGISEPSTLITDYVLGALTAALARRAARGPQSQRHNAIRFFAAALGATAFASFAGGTFHGFGPAMSPAAGALLWTLTTVAMGVASAFLLAAAITAAFTGLPRRMLLIVAAVKLLGYSWWMLTHHAFVYVILEYGSTLLVVLVLLATNRIRGERGHRTYLAAGILLSIAAAGIQQSGIRLHRHFNHNDLMHVVQMGAVWLLYQGGHRLQDAPRRT
jgi:hypothetical protein